MPKHGSKPIDHAVNARLKQLNSMTDSSEQGIVAKGDVLVKAANKKQRPLLKPPKPSQGKQLDTCLRMNIKHSSSDYAVAWEAKGSPTSNEKPYTLPL